ncbi:MAG: hypothetical protein ACTSQS_04460 [Promethearchaeota archaeon]
MNENVEGDYIKINLNKWFITFLIFLGFFIRILMLFFYYYVNLNPDIKWGGWGDVGLNYDDINSIFTGEWIWSPRELAYPPLSIYLLLFLRIASFDNILIYVFYAFLIELFVVIIFYFVLKKFEIPNRNLIYAIFLLNPFYFLNYVFSASNCGYHITDSFFCLLLLLAVYYYPNESKSKFYLFLSLSICAKWYTLPAAILFFMKFFFEKNWNEIKKIVIYIGIPIFIFLISPIFYLPNYLDLYRTWLETRNTALKIKEIPIYIKIIPFTFLFLIYLLLRNKNADLMEITFFSIILMFSIMVWSRLFLRFLTPLIYYGHLKTNDNIFKIDLNLKLIKLKFKVGNHLLTYFLSILGCIASYAIIIFVFKTL